MGMGNSYHCEKCKNDFKIFLGVGMGFPMVYDKEVEKIKRGDYGEEWRKLLESNPDAKIDAEKKLYVCPGCKHWESAPDLSIYIPNNPDNLPHERVRWIAASPLEEPNYVTYNELEEYYHMLKERVHECPKCSKVMHIANEREATRLKCPRCGAIADGLINDILWD